jgi:hypothetical protein
LAVSALGRFGSWPFRLLAVSAFGSFGFRQFRP